MKSYFEVLDMNTGKAFMGSRVQCLSFIEGWRYKIFRKENNQYFVW